MYVSSFNLGVSRLSPHGLRPNQDFCPTRETPGESRFVPGWTENPTGLNGTEIKMYLLGSAQPHPHFEPPEE